MASQSDLIERLWSEVIALPKNKKTPRSVANYFSALDLNLDPAEDDSDWIADLGKDPQEDSPFGDTGPTIKRLLSAGATKSDLGAIAAWQNYAAILKVHEFIKESGHMSSKACTKFLRDRSFRTRRPSRLLARQNFIEIHAQDNHRIALESSAPAPRTKVFTTWPFHLAPIISLPLVHPVPPFGMLKPCSSAMDL